MIYKVKSSAGIITILIGFAILLIVSVYYVFYRRNLLSIINRYPEQSYIAHGGGAIDGYLYTNSLEAIENAINKGFKYIELDLSLTADSFIVAAHDWDMFAQMTGYQSESGRPPTLREFEGCMIYDKYTPVTVEIIDSLFSANPELVLVTDKLDDSRILSAQLPSLSGRVLIECFSIERYQDALAYGWGMPMSSYVDLSPESINVVNVKGKRYTWAGIFPMTFALYGKERCTRRDADSIFALDPRVRFVYVDIVE